MPCGLSHWVKPCYTLEYGLTHTAYVYFHIVDDVLDSVLAGSDDEAEEDAVISQVSSFANLDPSG